MRHQALCARVRGCKLWSSARACVWKAVPCDASLCCPTINLQSRGYRTRSFWKAGHICRICEWRIVWKCRSDAIAIIKNVADTKFAGCRLQFIEEAAFLSSIENELCTTIFVLHSIFKCPSSCEALYSCFCTQIEFSYSYAQTYRHVTMFEHPPESYHRSACLSPGQQSSFIISRMIKTFAFFAAVCSAVKNR